MLKGFKDKIILIRNIDFGKIGLALLLVTTMIFGSFDEVQAITPDWGNAIASKYYSTSPPGLNLGFYQSGNWTFWMSVNQNNDIIIEGTATSEDTSRDPDEGWIIVTKPYPEYNTGIKYNPNNDYAIVLTVWSEYGSGNVSENIYPKSATVRRPYQVDMSSPNIRLYTKSKPNTSPTLSITSPGENSYFSKIT